MNANQKSIGGINKRRRLESLPPSPVLTHSIRKKRRNIWIAACFVAILLLGTFFVLHPVNRLLEWLLVYETPMKNVDVVLVGSMGGELDTAIRLYKEGLANCILITKGLPDNLRDEETPFSLYSYINNYILESGVPKKAVDSLPRTAQSMLERQTMIREWFLAHDFASYLQFSDRYSSRHKKSMHDDTFPKGDVTLVLYTSEGKQVERKHWLHIQNTIIRMIYWTMVYRPQIRSQNEMVGNMTHVSKTVSNTN